MNQTVSAYKLSLIQKEFVYSLPPPSGVGREDTMSGIRGDEVLVGLEDVLGETEVGCSRYMGQPGPKRKQGLTSGEGWAG